MTDDEIGVLEAAGVHFDAARTPCPSPERGCEDRYCSHSWVEPCGVCHEPIKLRNAYDEALGNYHTGCFGWPACSCPTSHRGDCS